MDGLQVKNCDQTPRNAFKLDIVRGSRDIRLPSAICEKNKYSVEKLSDRNYYLNNILINESRPKQRR